MTKLKSSKVTRPVVDSHAILMALTDMESELMKRLNKHGRGSYASVHEVAGVMLEEFTEFSEAIRDDENRQASIDELFDIAVTAIFGIASIREVYGLGHDVTLAHHES